ncbi:MAG: transcription termination factor NusA [Dehalococcoidia bacterium]
MKNEFLLAITQLAAERNLPKDLVFKVVEDALLSTYRKEKALEPYDLSVKVLPGTGEIKVYAQKTVVESPEDEYHEISLEEARKIKKDANIGDTVDVLVRAPDAGRIGVNVAKQVVMQRLHEAENEFIMGTFAHREGDIISGVIQRRDGYNITVDLGKAEGILPPSEQVRTENYRPGQRLRLYLLEVSQTNKSPRILLSRTNINLVRRLFELEVPEISNGLVQIEAIAREPGARTKLAVAETQQGIDAVGSCIGLRGVRIQNVINEFQGEKIDIVQWSQDPKTFIANALSPAHVLEVIADPVEGALAVVPDNQFSLAIGREGQNVRLAANLTGWKIDIKSASTVEEERAAQRAEEVTATEEEPVETEEQAVEEEVAEEEEEEELTPVESIIGEGTPPAETGGLRFAEDILPAKANAQSEDSKGKKKQATKGKTKKKKPERTQGEDEDEIQY